MSNSSQPDTPLDARVGRVSELRRQLIHNLQKVGSPPATSLQTNSLQIETNPSFSSVRKTLEADVDNDEVQPFLKAAIDYDL